MQLKVIFKNEINTNVFDNNFYASLLKAIQIINIKS